jgi:hypothetical protein
MRKFVLTLLAGSAAVAADEPTNGSRFYAGLGLATLEIEDQHRGIELDDSALVLAPYAGFRLRDNLDLEVAYLRADDVGANDIPGSGIARLDIDETVVTAVVRAVQRFSLSEWLEWRRSWQLFGTVGYYRTDIDRTVTTLSTGAREALRHDETGLALGAGVLYQAGPVDLRGYVEWFGVLDDREAREAGVAVQVSF